MTSSRGSGARGLNGSERAAATLIVFRNADPQPEILMIRRSTKLAFAGGAFAFPGGAVDADDIALSESFAGDPEWNAARICAVRETLEETGLLVGIAQPVTASDASEARSALLGGMPFSQILAENGWQVDPDALVPFARWVPQMAVARRFDARFLLADLGTGAVSLSADGTETADHIWTGAQAMIDRADRGEASIIFPTRMNLARVALFSDFAAARAQAEAIKPEIVQTVEERRGDDLYMGVDEGFGYPTNIFVRR